MFDTGGVAGKLARAHALIADAAAGISSETSGPAAAEALREAVAADSQLTLVVCLLAERVDRTGLFAADGAVSMASWLRTEAKSTAGWASTRIASGRLLADSLPATQAAWAAGRLNFEHVKVIAAYAKGLDDGQLTALDRALAAAADDATPTMLKDIAAAISEHLAPDRTEKHRDDAARAQSVHLSDLGDGGRLDGNLDGETTALLRAALAKFTPDGVPTVSADGTVAPPLPLSHRQALGLAEMARQALDFGAGHPGAANKPHLVISLSYEDLADQVGVGYLPSGGTIAAADIRRLACDAKIIPLLLGAAGQPLDIGRTSRTIPPHLRIALNERDKGCRHPDCQRPPAACDAHHIDHWVDGGTTSLDNLLLLCRAHHRQNHKGKLHIHKHGNQQFTITKTLITRRT